VTPGDSPDARGGPKGAICRHFLSAESRPAALLWSETASDRHLRATEAHPCGQSTKTGATGLEPATSGVTGRRSGIRVFRSTMWVDACVEVCEHVANTTLHSAVL
jgi:hypothetical protein